MVCGCPHLFHSHFLFVEVLHEVTHFDVEETIPVKREVLHVGLGSLQGDLLNEARHVSGG